MLNFFDVSEDLYPSGKKPVISKLEFSTEIQTDVSLRKIIQI